MLGDDATFYAAGRVCAKAMRQGRRHRQWEEGGHCDCCPEGTRMHGGDEARKVC